MCVCVLKPFYPLHLTFSFLKQGKVKICMGEFLISVKKSSRKKLHKIAAQEASYEW